MCFFPVRELCLLLTDFFKRSVIPQFFFFFFKKAETKGSPNAPVGGAVGSFQLGC